MPRAQAKWPSLVGLKNVKSGVGKRWEQGGLEARNQGNITTKGGGDGGGIGG